MPGIGIRVCPDCGSYYDLDNMDDPCPVCEFSYEADKLDGRMVEIERGDGRGFVGRAVDQREHGWIAVDLNAIDIEDDRVIYQVDPRNVILRKDLEELFG